MPLFGGENRKLKFDARQPPQEIIQNPRDYSFIHNFKVHYKQSSLQVLAGKFEVSITSSSPHLPSAQEVTYQFNRRIPHKQRRSSFHVTDIEYKESFALSYGSKKSPMPVAIPVNQATGSTMSGSMFCSKCGTKLASSSRYCSNCGASQS
jgi:hypothetical protein